MGRNIEHRCNKNVKVFFRILPMVKMEWEHFKVLDDGKTAYIRCMPPSKAHTNPCPTYWKFETDGIFYNNNQEDIYNSVIADGVLQRIMEGCNAIILAYGQTGCGKSLTIGGLQNSFQDRGIAPRIIADVFQLKHALKDKYKVCMKMSYLETSRTVVVDLLNDNPKNGRSSVLNVTALKVENIYSALKVLFKAEARRNMNIDSHKANGLFTLHVFTKQLNLTNPEVRVSKIHLVDLAGVDIYGNVTSVYKSVFELGGANTAKSQLEQFMLILCQNNPVEIHFKQRLNPIIQYLGDALNGKSILRYIGHVRIDMDNILITLSMLRFGQLVRGLKPLKLHNNIIEDKEAKLNIIQEEVRKAHVEKDLEVMMANQDLTSNVTQERIKHMQNVAEEYLHNKTNEIVLLNVTDATIVLQVFKHLYAQLENEKNECLKAAIDRSSEERNNKLIPSKNDIFPLAKTSKRGSKSLKSKESLISSNRISQTKSHRKSDRTISPSPSLAKSIDKNRADSPKASLRRSRTSSLIKRSGSRKRSAHSTTSVGTDLNDHLAPNSSLPATIPDQQEAWEEFVADPEYNYQELANNLDIYETSAKDSRIIYLEEVKILQTIFDMVDLRKSELERVQMQRLLHKEQYTEDGNLKVSETEKHCLENVKNAHEGLVIQQEKVLRNQALYRLSIESYINAKKEINEKFQLYCQDKYQTPMAAMSIDHQSSSEQVTHEETIISSVSLEAKQPSFTAPQINQEVLQYEKLKLQMKKQIARMVKEKATKRKWVQSCKI